MNAMVGERLSIITKKPQTTRHRILGIVNAETYQIIFSDTPGKVLDPAYKMHYAMNAQIRQALEDADVIIFLTDVESPFEEVIGFAEEFRKIEYVPKILALNKVDLLPAEQVKPLLKRYERADIFDHIMPVSALKTTGVRELFNLIVSHLPPSPPYFPKDQLTDRSERFFIAEIIREKILELYYQELPYSVEVIVESFEEREGKKGPFLHIRVVIFVMRNSQKAILIGKGGAAMKALGSAARKDIEEFVGRHVYLELHVKVRENWRDDDRMLKYFGYKS